MANKIFKFYAVDYHDKGDYAVDEKYIFEIGGAAKNGRQLENQANAYIVADDIETGVPRQIPLWLFGVMW